ncbi:MAG: DUF3810 family protein [Planctomycetota bacterium]
MTTTEQDSVQDAAEAPEEEPRPRALAYDGPTVRDDVRRWVRCVIPLAVALLVSVVARFAPSQVEEIYSRGIYPRVASLVEGPARSWAETRHAAGLSRTAPSFSEVLLLAVLLLVVLLLGHAAFKGIGTFVRRCFWVVGLAALSFVGLWGLNHARAPLAQTLHLDVSPVAVGELDQVADEMAIALTALLEQSIQPVDRESVPGRAAEAWARALGEVPSLGWQERAIVVGPKLSETIVSAGISGIFSPFSQEAHVAAHLPDPDLLFTALHEIAHVQGWAREDEANYLAWRVGSRSGDLDFERAALIISLAHVHRALEQADRELMAARWHDLDPRIKAQFSARAAFWGRERSMIASRAASAVNEVYLRSHGHGGVATYGRMVDLIVAEWRSGDRADVLR